MKHETLEQMLRAGRNWEVLCEAEHLVDQPETAPLDSLWISVWACRAAGGRREWGRAVAWAERGLALGALSAEAEGILRFSVARAMLYIGDLIRAERELDRFLHLAAETPRLTSAVGDAYYNRGHLHRLLSRTGAAVAAFHQATREYAAHGRTYRSLLCQYEIAWTYLLCGDADSAEPYLQDLRQGGSESADEEFRIDLALAEGLYHTLRGFPDRAESVCQCLLQRSDLPPRQQAELHWLLGHASLLQNDLRSAANHLSDSQRAAAQDWWPPQLERITRLQEDVTARQGGGR